MESSSENLFLKENLISLLCEGGLLYACKQVGLTRSSFIKIADSLDLYVPKGTQCPKFIERICIFPNKAIAIDDILKYYIEENHSFIETREHFGISDHQIKKAIRFFNILKPRKLSHVHNKKTCLKLYGDENFNNIKQAQQTCLEKYGCVNPFQVEIFKLKGNQTKQERYDNFKFVNPLKTQQTNLKKYGYKYVAQVPRFQEKARDTCFQHFGVKYPMQSAEVQAKYNFEDISKKSAESKKINGTSNTSKPEKDFYEALCKIFGSADIETQYRDEQRYPFYCDFYIKSLDLFIELNLYFTHGGHPFNKDSQEDTEKLAVWEAKAEQSLFYRNAIKVWTISDPYKFQVAVQNKLNYSCIYNLQELALYLEEINNKYAKIL